MIPLPPLPRCHRHWGRPLPVSWAGGVEMLCYPPLEQGVTGRRCSGCCCVSLDAELKHPRLRVSTLRNSLLVPDRAAAAATAAACQCQCQFKAWISKPGFLGRGCYEAWRFDAAEIRSLDSKAWRIQRNWMLRRLCGGLIRPKFEAWIPRLGFALRSHMQDKTRNLHLILDV